MQRKWRLAAAAAAAWHCWERQSLLGWRRLCRIHFTPMNRQQSCASLRCRIFLPAKQALVPADSTAPDTSSNVTLALFGVVPVKTVRAVTTARRTVHLCVVLFGVKLFSDGALVVAFSDRYTALGSENPAKAAGLRLGSHHLGKWAAGAQQSGSDPRHTGGRCAADCAYRRGESQCMAVLTPTRDENGCYKAGIWVRDSGAGIGTLSFIDPLHGTFAGLGQSAMPTPVQN